MHIKFIVQTMNINKTNYQSITVNDEQEQDATAFHKIPPASIKNNRGLQYDGSVKTSAYHSAYVEDHLAPPYDSDERPSNLFVGTFNLIATIIGGGVLSLPVVFEKCGIAFSELRYLFLLSCLYVLLLPVLYFLALFFCSYDVLIYAFLICLQLPLQCSSLLT